MNGPAPSDRWARLAWAARALLGLVFLVAAWPKLTQPHAFAEAIFRYHLLPDAAINAAAVYLPWLELLCGLVLVLNLPGRQGALLLVLGMLLVFTAAIGSSLYRGINIACGCFSVESGKGPIGWLNLARNAALIALGIAGWRR